MKWSPQQDQALVAISRWINTPVRHRPPVFRLFGFAGTGKTTLARTIADGVNGRVQAAAFTGKAAHVLNQKGLPARTIHSLIYRTQPKGKTQLLELEAELARLVALPEATPEEIEEARKRVKAERQRTSQPSFGFSEVSDLNGAALLIIDECSMVDTKMGEDLLRYGVPILVLGDPAQLPPVFGGGYFTNQQPDFMLTEIHRQALDNPIVWLSREVREGRELKPGAYGESLVQHGSKLDPAIALSYDQILVGRNATRRASNNRARILLGRQGVLPSVGDRLVCLRNDHTVGLLNGSLWVATKDAVDDGGAECILEIRADEAKPDSDPLLVTAHRHHFVAAGDEKLPWWEEQNAQSFDYGYALTVHKAQGSQWNKVLVIDEWTNRETRRQWLYTAITRAAERLLLAKVR